MSTDTDGAPPSVAPGSTDDPGAAETAESGAAWLQAEIQRRMAAARNGAGGRHARHGGPDPTPPRPDYRARHASEPATHPPDAPGPTDAAAPAAPQQAPLDRAAAPSDTTAANGDAAPADTTSPPGVTGDDPAGAAGTEPASAAWSPGGSNAEPAGAATRPGATGADPAGATRRPDASGADPAGATRRPSAAGTEPASAASSPGTTGGDPARAAWSTHAAGTEPASAAWSPGAGAWTRPPPADPPAPSGADPSTADVLPLPARPAPAPPPSAGRAVEDTELSAEPENATLGTVIPLRPPQDPVRRAGQPPSSAEDGAPSGLDEPATTTPAPSVDPPVDGPAADDGAGELVVVEPDAPAGAAGESPSTGGAVVGPTVDTADGVERPSDTGGATPARSEAAAAGPVESTSEPTTALPVQDEQPAADDPPTTGPSAVEQTIPKPVPSTWSGFGRAGTAGPGAAGISGFGGPSRPDLPVRRPRKQATRPAPPPLASAPSDITPGFAEAAPTTAAVAPFPQDQPIGARPITGDSSAAEPQADGSPDPDAGLWRPPRPGDPWTPLRPVPPKGDAAARLLADPPPAPPTEAIPTVPGMPARRPTAAPVPEHRATADDADGPGYGGYDYAGTYGRSRANRYDDDDDHDGAAEGYRRSAGHGDDRDDERACYRDGNNADHHVDDGGDDDGGYAGYRAGFRAGYRDSGRADHRNGDRVDHGADARAGYRDSARTDRRDSVRVDYRRDQRVDDRDDDDEDYDDDDGPDSRAGDDGVIWRAATPPAAVTRSAALATPLGRSVAPHQPTPQQSTATADAPAGSTRWAASSGPAVTSTGTGAEPARPADSPPPPGKRVRVVLAERKAAARPVRTVVDLQGDSPVGEALRSGLIVDQMRVALRFALLGGLTLGVLPLLFNLVPELGTLSILGLRLPWLALGIMVYPFLLGLGWWFTRTAERVEQDFADHIQDS